MTFKPQQWPYSAALLQESITWELTAAVTSRVSPGGASTRQRTRSISPGSLSRTAGRFPSYIIGETTGPRQSFFAERVSQRADISVPRLDQITTRLTPTIFTSTAGFSGLANNVYRRDRVDPAHVEKLLGKTFKLKFEQGISNAYHGSAEEIWDWYTRGFGPLRQLAESLPRDRVERLKRDVDAYHQHYAVPAGLHVKREYLLTVGHRR